MSDLSPLGRHILKLCKDQNFSLREGSMLSGLAPETISKILRRGKATTPRPDTIKALANGLGGNYEYMMQLAGHLPPPPDNEQMTAEQQGQVNTILSIWHEIADLDKTALGKLLNVVENQAEMMRAVLQASRREKEQRSESDM